MGRLHPPEKAVLFAGLLYGDAPPASVADNNGEGRAGAVENPITPCDAVLRSLVELFGPVAVLSDEFRWDYFSHYRDELGPAIVRRFAAFAAPLDAGGRTPFDAGGRAPFDAAKLAEVKHLTIGLESGFSIQTPGGPRRTVNIDPGYVTLSKVVLATTKDYSHRVYLRDGIFAEVTLYYKDGAFRPHVFTYRDYVEPEAIRFLTAVRGLLKGK